MYQLSRAHEAQAQPEKALAVLDQLVAKYPQSQWYTEAQFRRGEILFSAGRYRDAELAYNAVVKAGPEGGFYEQGLYKHGWSLFKQSRGEESVASFLKVLDRVLVERRQAARARLARRARSASSPKTRCAPWPSRSPISTVPRRSTPLLKQRGSDPVYAHLLYEGLGNLYITRSASRTRRWRSKRSRSVGPTIAIAPSLQMRTIEAYQKGGFASLVLEGKQAFVERYAFGSAFWQTRTVADAPEVAAQLKTNAEGPRRVFPREGAEEQERRGLHGRGALVSRDAGFVPAGRGSAGDTLPAGRSAVRIGTLCRSGARVRAHGV